MIGGLLLVLVFANLYTIIQRWKERSETGAEYAGSAHRTAIRTLIGLNSAIVGLFVLAICLFEPRWTLRICVIAVGAVIVFLSIGLLTQSWNWKRWAIWGVCAVLCAGSIAGYELYQRHLDKITLPEHFDFMTYLPFTEGSLVVTPDEEPTLHFSDKDYLPRMDGATALYPVYAAFAQATYPDDLSDLEEDDKLDLVDCTTTNNAYLNIVNGESDIIFVAGPSKEQEAYAKRKEVELVYTPIGQEAFVFFVHPDNPIDGLHLDEIRGIYSGTITKWNELGVSGLGNIRAYQRDEGSGSQTALERFVMGDTPLMPPETESYEDGMGGMIEQVSDYKNHRNAIGFSFRFYCTTLMKDFRVKLLAVNGVEPTLENIENGAYPLASSFYAVTRSDADENTRALVEWICGPQGQALVEKTGYTPIQ